MVGTGVTPASRSHVCTCVPWCHLCKTRPPHTPTPTPAPRPPPPPAATGAGSPPPPPPPGAISRPPPLAQPNVFVDVPPPRGRLAGREKFAPRRLVGAEELPEEPPLGQQLVNQDGAD